MPLWIAPAPLVLASKSVARRAVLEQAGIPVEICPADIDERAVEAAAPPQTPPDAALLLARAKAKSVSAKMPGRIVLGADQTLALGSKRFSKPADRNSARSQLIELSGQIHTLYSALVLFCDGDELYAGCERADMTMRRLTVDFVETYLDAAGARALSSVGGYQVEGLGIQLFERIEGDYFAILGLPILPLLGALRRAGLIAS